MIKRIRGYYKTFGTPYAEYREVTVFSTDPGDSPSEKLNNAEFRVYKGAKLKSNFLIWIEHLIMWIVMSSPLLFLICFEEKLKPYTDKVIRFLMKCVGWFLLKIGVF